MTGTVNLLTNVGDATGADITGDWFTWDGGPGDLWVWGDLGGGRIDLQAALDTSAPLDVCSADVSKVTPTSSSVTKFNFNHGTQIRAVLIGTSASSGVYVKANS